MRDHVERVQSKSQMRKKTENLNESRSIRQSTDSPYQNAFNTLNPQRMSGSKDGSLILQRKRYANQGSRQSM